MAEYRALSESEFVTLKARLAKRAPRPHAIAASYDARRHVVKVRLDTGLAFEFDPARARGLEGASPDELAGVTVQGAGGALHFPRLDSDLTVSRLLEDFLGPLDWARREARAATSRPRLKSVGKAKGAAAG